MSMYEDLLDETVTRLIGTEEEPLNFGLTPKFIVKKLPEYKAQYEPLKASQNGRIYVAFGTHHYGTEKEPTNALLGIAAQDSDPYVTISIAAREMYGPLGLLTYLWLTTGLLVGMPFSWGGELSAFSADILDFKDGTWYYQLILRIKDFPVVPITNFREPGLLSDSLLEKLTYHDERNNEDTTEPDEE